VTGEDERARPLFERSLGLFRRLGDPHGVALSLYGLAVVRPAGALRAARTQAAESLDILRAVGDRRTFAKVLWNLADIDAEFGDAAAATAQFEESLTLFLEFGDRWFSELVLESAAFLAAATGDVERAVRLLGAADVVLGEIGVPLLARLRERHDGVLSEARTALGARRFEAAWEDGTRIPLGETVELMGTVRSNPNPDPSEGLTTRELEVLALVAEGRTDAEVAETLVLSIRTVNAHLRSIYRKLDVHSRSAATRYAFQHGLAV
jgi:DNA-binding CsgD family transcriptional regulator